MGHYYYKVAPIGKVIRANEPFLTYHHEQKLSPGTLVRIPVGTTTVNGIIFDGNKQRPTFTTKPLSPLADIPTLPIPLLKLAQWLSEYYSTHLATVLQTILPTGLHKQRRSRQAAHAHPIRKRTNIVLNNQQSAAFAAIKNANSGTILIHGVTGSGKTQVYIESIKDRLSRGMSAIILVPEIALTPQLVAELSQHFPRLIVTHSGMTEAARHMAWQQANNQISSEPTVVIGPRSALFMPLHNLGIIVIDESHEPSYKQEQSPRYSALRAATMLAKYHTNAVTILGSATPSITDYYLALHAKHPILELTKPAIHQKIPPKALIIDTKNKDKFKKHRFFCDPLLDHITEALSQQQQVLLFHNRRGSAPTTICDQCGWLAECPTCILPLTLHADHHILRCHMCNRSQAVPPQCPECRQPTITFKGIGTKLIESETKKLFPKAKIARFDADTDPTQTVQHRYQELYDGDIDILIGTQIIAKGLDLPRLAVVGVLQADSGLMLPDYQSEERVFQLLYQVMGRVGRGQTEGKVIIQTYQPDHPAIQAALKRDYAGFYQEQLKKRRVQQFPPFTYLLKLTCSYKTEKGAIQAARKMAKAITAAYPNVQLFGPTPAFHERLGGTYRWQIIIKSAQRNTLSLIASSLPQTWQANIDPTNLL